MKIHLLDAHFLGHNDVIAAFLVEHDGALALVETGPHATFKTLCKAIKMAGFDWRDIKHVLLTHIHFDHAGAAWAMAEAGATIYVHPVGVRHLHDPTKLYNSAKMIYGDRMEELWGDMKGIPLEKIHPTADNEVLTFGGLQFRAIHTPGHAVHHIARQCGDAIFAGDAAGVKIGGGPVMPPCPPPDINIEDWKTSLDKIQAAKPAALWLTHFGEIRHIEEHLAELRKRLDAWATWMYPYYLSGEAAASITPKFMAFVAADLLANGVPQTDIARYEGANPSWMSVAGLLRYWNKKEGTKVG